MSFTKTSLRLFRLFIVSILSLLCEVNTPVVAETLPPLAAPQSAQASSEIADDGPFGFRAGDNIDKYKKICVHTIYYGSFACSTAPRPHPDASRYFVKTTPETGICRVVAEFKDSGQNQPDDYFREPVSTDSEIVSQLELSYGKYKYENNQYIWDRTSGAVLRNMVNKITYFAGKHSIFFDMTSLDRCNEVINHEREKIQHSKQLDKSKSF